MEQLSLDLYDTVNSDDEKPSEENNVTNKDDLFGCCYRYRECSNAKKCLISNREDSSNCVYRKNLEKGKIFYGKYADDFDINTYNKLLDTYNALDKKTRHELNCAIIYFVKYRTSVLWYTSDEVYNLQQLGFCHLVTPKVQVLELSDSNFLNRFLPADVKSLLNKQAKQREGNQKARIKKQDVINWLLHNTVFNVDEYIRKFTLLSFPDKLRQYIFEIYYDYLVNDVTDYKTEIIKRLPRKNEPSFIKQKDDNNNDF